MAERKNGLVVLVVSLSLAAMLIFIFGCFNFSVSSPGCGACRFINNFQTLIAGILALLAAVIASLLVHEQVRVARVQSAVMTRDVLTKRLGGVRLRRRMSIALVNSITNDFNRVIYPDPDGCEPEINPHWAHEAQQVVSLAVERLKGVQRTRSDPAAISAARENLILVARELGACLDLIPVPDRAPWEDEELGMSQEEQAAAAARAEADAKTAEKELPGKITAVRRAGKALDVTYWNLLEALRTQLRKIDDSILDGSV